MFLLLIVTVIVLHLYLRYGYPVSRWRKPPTYEEYMRDHAGQFRGNRPQCNFCGSTSIRNVGARHAADKLRIHSCNQCGKTLYRSKS